MRFLTAMVVGFVMFMAVNLSAQSVYTKVSPTQLKAWMIEEGYKVSIDKDGDILWKIGDYKSYIYFYKNNESIQFGMSFNSSSVTLDKINKFNREYRYGRCVMPKAGVVRLESDLGFFGGVTKAHVIDFLQTCEALQKVWIEKVVE